LVNITAASPSDIRAFAHWLPSPSAAFAEATAKGEGDPLIGRAAGFFIENVFLLLRRARETNYHLISASFTITRRIHTLLCQR